MRSEIPEVAVEVSLQPWRNYKTDGCILFSDILTPLPGMGCEFTIDEKLGPLMEPCKKGTLECNERGLMILFILLYLYILLSSLRRFVKNCQVFIWLTFILFVFTHFPDSQD